MDIQDRVSDAAGRRQPLTPPSCPRGIKELSADESVVPERRAVAIGAGRELGAALVHEGPFGEGGAACVSPRERRLCLTHPLALDLLLAVALRDTQMNNINIPLFVGSPG